MAIIWGYRRPAAKDLGPVLAVTCSSCGALDFWHLHRSMTWFTLFFIPVLPLLRQHFLLCPKCGNGMELERAGGVAAKRLLPHTLAFSRGELGKDTYLEAVRESGFLGPDGAVNVSFVRVKGLSRTMRVLISLVLGLVGLFAFLALLARFGRPALAGYGALAGFALGAAVGVWLSGLPRKREREKLVAARGG
ncbi:MAG TPA: zinc-ribbon domain-containing protein [Candidatus Limnocylindria bacterium]|jgi:hypothetical protein|nr:zinc-ribbon domain-containing protein [Candidatus Limnocylindria bacterium]